LQCDLVREIFGNPFTSIAAIDPAWLAWGDGTIVGLARAAYEERDPERGSLDAARLGVLADALEEAGCPDTAILGHLRGKGFHTLGCWALDLILGKS
jgi:hypothetical protein